MHKESSTIEPLNREIIPDLSFVVKTVCNLLKVAWTKFLRGARIACSISMKEASQIREPLCNDS